jgi:hypothetical protein
VAGSANPSLPPAAAAFTATGALAAGQSRFTNQGGWWLAAATTQLSVQDGTSPTAYSDPSPVTSLVEVIGNSISTARDYNAMSRVANALGAVEVNYSHPGMVHCWDDAGTNPCGYATARQRMVRFNKQVGTFGQLGYGAESDLVFIASPQNDLWALAATNARAVLKHGIRSIISHALVASIFEETDAALTFTGTWATVTNPGPPQAKVGTGADSSGTGYKYSSTQGDSFTVKIPGDYPGSARSPLVLAFVGYPTAANSTALLTASGAATGTFDLSPRRCATTPTPAATGWCGASPATRSPQQRHPADPDDHVDDDHERSARGGRLRGLRDRFGDGPAAGDRAGRVQAEPADERLGQRHERAGRELQRGPAVGGRRVRPVGDVPRPGLDPAGDRRCVRVDHRDGCAQRVGDDVHVGVDGGDEGG